MSNFVNFSQFWSSGLVFCVSQKCYTRQKWRGLAGTKSAFWSVDYLQKFTKYAPSSIFWDMCIASTMLNTLSQFSHVYHISIHAFLLFSFACGAIRHHDKLYQYEYNSWGAMLLWSDLSSLYLNFNKHVLLPRVFLSKASFRPTEKTVVFTHILGLHADGIIYDPGFKSV